MATRIVIGRDLAGRSIDIYREFPPSDTSFYALLVANVEQEVPIPVLSDLVVFSFDKDINVLVSFSGNSISTTDNLALEDGSFVLLEDGDNLLLEGASVFVQGGIDLNPAVRTILPGVTSISLTSDANGQAVLNFYNRNNPGLI